MYRTRYIMVVPENMFSSFYWKSTVRKVFLEPSYTCHSIFLLTGLRIYTGDYKAQGPTLCPTEGRALLGQRALYSPVLIRKPVSKKFIA